MYRVLALDLDGTLLRRDGSVDPRDIAAITAVRAAGVAVTIVTGRLHSGALDAARACAIDGAIACMEGSHLVDVASGATLARHHLPPAITARLRETFATHRLASFVFDADGIDHDADGATYSHYVRTWSPNLRVVDAALAEAAWSRSPIAAVAIGDRDAVLAAAEYLRGADLFSVSFAVAACPGKHAVLVRAAGPDKGNALADLCARLGLTTADAVAVGDWVNDIPMLRVAGRSFAMSDAPAAVRAAATELLSHAAGDGGGIAEAIERVWGIS